MKITLVALVLGIVTAVCIWIFLYNGKAKVTSEDISAMLSKESKLITATLHGKGFSTYTDEGLPIISQGNFLMIYEYEVSAGIDIEKVNSVVDEKNEIVRLTIPEAEIFSIKVDPTSIKYYDESFVLFNTNEREDANLAQAEAEKHARKTAEETGILTLANTQSEALIRGIVEKSLPKEYTVEIKNQ